MKCKKSQLIGDLNKDDGTDGTNDGTDVAFQLQRQSLAASLQNDRHPHYSWSEVEGPANFIARSMPVALTRKGSGEHARAVVRFARPCCSVITKIARL